MLPAGEILEQARKARDARFDGRFFVGVRTTGIYCRPVCPVKLPQSRNVVFFANAASAVEAGYRPCLRCRPESSPGTPAWRGTSTTVSRALRLINEGALDTGSVTALSERLGITPRHLNRLFVRHLGASPKTIAQTRRLQFAKRLIDQTSLPLTEIALVAGYGSIRRFNDHFQKTYQRSPRSLRKDSEALRGSTIRLRVKYREPFDFESLIAFYAIRATPGVERTVDGCYRRNFVLDGEAGSFEVSNDPAERQLVCDVEGGSSRSLMTILNRVRRMFDVDAIPEDVNETLSLDPQLKKLVGHHPGLRLPGAFDEFETAVRAIVGQQVSVKGATTVMGIIAERYGARYGNELVFPDAQTLSKLDPMHLPMPGKRAQAIRELARRIHAREIRFDEADENDFIESLISIPGIGPWTAQYISLRARGNPDAFLHGDLVIRKVALQLLDIEKESDLIAYAEQWRPWRGYAGMHLWRYAADQGL
jgi:AraC family transcriptional regulator of adaptative response / DNA-3-methyladenine glycosylase II